MKFVSCLVLAIAISGLACAKAPLPRQGERTFDHPTSELKLIGYWELNRPQSEEDLKAGVPMRLRFMIDESKHKIVHYCGPKARGWSGWDLDKSKVSAKLVFLKKSDSGPAMPTEMSLDTELSKINADEMVLNGKYTYKRFKPKQNLTALDDAAPLCDKAPAAQ